MFSVGDDEKGRSLSPVLKESSQTPVLQELCVQSIHRNSSNKTDAKQVSEASCKEKANTKQKTIHNENQQHNYCEKDKDVSLVGENVVPSQQGSGRVHQGTESARSQNDVPSPRRSLRTRAVPGRNVNDTKAVENNTKSTTVDKNSCGDVSDKDPIRRLAEDLHYNTKCKLQLQAQVKVVVHPISTSVCRSPSHDASAPVHNTRSRAARLTLTSTELQSKSNTAVKTQKLQDEFGKNFTSMSVSSESPPAEKPNAMSSCRTKYEPDVAHGAVHNLRSHKKGSTQLTKFSSSRDDSPELKQRCDAMPAIKFTHIVE